MSSLARSYGLLALLALGLTACQFSDKKAHCKINGDCTSGRACYLGFCVASAAGSGGSQAGSGGSKAGSGAAGAGGAAADGGAGKPSAECKAGEQRACVPDAGSKGNATCNRGTQTCTSGHFGDCVADPQPSTELCNGVDDDCDGQVDEDSSMPCYPSGMLGCVFDANNVPKCSGVCSVGKRTCAAGQLGECSGYVGPSMEVCTTTGSGADENCDGAIDENCVCNKDQACYSGPANTENTGACLAGKQVCTNGALGACTGSVVPAAESCANQGADNDCNGTVDDIAGLEAACTDSSKQGPCRVGKMECSNGALTCVTPAGTTEVCNGTDDDCNGTVDDGFDLQNDPMHCGSCTKSCAAGESCCSGNCVNTATDSNNCGACGAAHACAAGNSCCSGACFDLQKTTAHCGMCTTACSAGSMPACCGGSCVDLVSDANCGQCGHACGMVSGAAGSGGAGAGASGSSAGAGAAGAEAGSGGAGSGGSAGSGGAGAGSGGASGAGMCTCQLASGAAMCVAPAPGVCL